MSNLVEYKNVIDDKLHDTIFISDPKFLDTNIYINTDFSSTIQQLYILRNWDTLSKKITEDELWAYLRLHEYRTSKLVFNSVSGNLIADAASQDLYKKYYYNALWLTDCSQYLNIFTLMFIIILLTLFYYITNLWQKQITSAAANNLLELLEISTRAQQLQ